MGEYWQVCNLTRKQMYDQRNGYKTRGTMTNEMRGAVMVLLAIGAWAETDDIRLLSDSGGERLLNKDTWEATDDRGPGTSEVQFCDLQDVHLELVVGPSPFQVVYTPASPGPASRSVAWEFGGSVAATKAVPWPPNAPRAQSALDGENNATVEDIVSSTLRYLGTRFQVTGYALSTAVEELERRSGVPGWTVEKIGPRLIVTPPRPRQSEPEPDE